MKQVVPLLIRFRRHNQLDTHTGRGV